MHTAAILFGGLLLIVSITMIIPSPISPIFHIGNKNSFVVSREYRLILFVLFSLSAIGFALTAGFFPIASLLRPLLARR